MYSSCTLCSLFIALSKLYLRFLFFPPLDGVLIPSHYFFFYFLFLVYFRLFLLSQVSPRQLSSFFFSFWLELHLQTFSLRLTLIIQQLGLDFVVRFEESWRDYVSELKSLPWTGLKCSLISVLLKQCEMAHLVSQTITNTPVFMMYLLIVGQR